MPEAQGGQRGKQNPRVTSKSIAWLHTGFFPLEEIRTLEQVVVKRLVGREDSCHLIVVRRMDVLINAVARELHLPQEEGQGQSPRQDCRGRAGGTLCVSQVCAHQGQDFDLC